MEEKVNAPGARRSVYQEITDHIVEAIQKGAARFEMPWHRGGGTLPHNAHTKRAYQGVNVLALWVAASARGYSSNVWATYRQWHLLDAQVKRGERGSLVVFYRPRDEGHEDDDTESRSRHRLIARASWVFNGDQVDGWSPPETHHPDPVCAVSHADAFVGATGAVIRHGGTRAYCLPSLDYIQMPERYRFKGSTTMSATEGYYATLLHELTHWVGHPSRMNRDLSGRFGDESYAMEELVAELGAAFLCAELSVTNIPRPDHAAYIENWLKVLKRDMRAIFTASTQAVKAVAYLTELQPAHNQSIQGHNAATVQG